jgi:hypothetical protein
LSYDQDFAKAPEITAFSHVERLQKGRKFYEETRKPGTSIIRVPHCRAI